jgi:hypothetical protein
MSVDFKKMMTLVVASAVIVALSGATFALAKDTRIEQRLRPGNSWAKHRSESGTMAARRSAPLRSSQSRESFSYEPSESGQTTTAVRRGCCGCDCPQEAAQPSESDTAVAPQGERRSFAYEPAEPSSSARSSSGGASGKALWDYPKTDPRRYRP